MTRNSYMQTANIVLPEVGTCRERNDIQAFRVRNSTFAIHVERSYRLVQWQPNAVFAKGFFALSVQCNIRDAGTAKPMHLLLLSLRNRDVLLQQQLMGPHLLRRLKCCEVFGIGAWTKAVWEGG